MAYRECPHCGEKVSTSSSSCIHCGQALKGKPSAKERRKRARRRAVKHFLITLLILIIIAGVLFAVWKFVLPNFVDTDKLFGGAMPEPTVIATPEPTPEPIEETSVDSESEFEKVLLKKGSLIVKEFTDCCLFEKDSYFDYQRSNEFFGFTDTLQFQSASILDVETGYKVYALRISTGYYNSKYSYGEAVGVMDADEIDGAIQTLKYIKQNISNMNDYSEVVYKANSGMEVGAYHSSDGEKIYVKVNSDATKFYSVDKIDSLIEAFEKVSATFNN